MADVLTVIHFLWAAWMVTGVAVAALGFCRPRVWQWRWFRTLHLLAFVGTATTPLWNRGVCPITTWEWQTRGRPGGEQASLMTRIFHDILYIDVDPLTISLVTGGLALFTVVMYVLRPPWRKYT